MRAMQTVTLIILTAVFLCSSVGLAATSGDTRARKRIDPRTKKPVYAESPAKAAEKPKLPKEEARIKASSSNKWMDLYEEHTFKGMPYRLLKPIDFDPSRTYPLILSLHGKGGCGTDNIKNLRIWTQAMAEPDLRRKHPCFVLAPQTPDSWRNPNVTVPEMTPEAIKAYPQSWQKYIERRIQVGRPIGYKPGIGDLLLAFELLEKITKQFKIDSNRIYVLGHSMGGFGTWNAIYERPKMFAAAIPTAGGLMPWHNPKKFARVPIWAFHGSIDPIVSVGLTREIFAAMQECGGNMKYTELPGVTHGVNSYAFAYTGDDSDWGFITKCSSDKCDDTQDIWDWLFRQKLSSRMTGSRKKRR
ncbi:MAG: prolyl oligopeptidase family serine peptidase [Planctomycetes bacterium]|nr:prolyl oligopeptidase family serine peptidase [Planctomycetota bacterium]